MAISNLMHSFEIIIGYHSNIDHSSFRSAMTGVPNQKNSIYISNKRATKLNLSKTESTIEEAKLGAIGFKFVDR